MPASSSWFTRWSVLAVEFAGEGSASVVIPKCAPASSQM